MSLQEAQTAAILSLLDLNPPTEFGTTKSTALVGNETPIWKVLILDKQTKDVLATVLRVQDLRDVGVTLYVLVKF